MGETMKLLLALLLTIPSSYSQQLVLFNVDSDSIAVVSAYNSKIKITLMPKATLLPFDCVDRNQKKIEDVNFSAAPFCLIESLNDHFNFNITDYVDLQNKNSIESIQTLSTKRELSGFMDLYSNTRTSFTMLDILEMYRYYEKKQLEIEWHYPILLKTDQGYLPLSN